MLYLIIHGLNTRRMRAGPPRIVSIFFWTRFEKDESVVVDFPLDRLLQQHFGSKTSSITMGSR